MTDSAFSQDGADYDAMLAALESGASEAELRERFPRLGRVIGELLRGRESKPEAVTLGPGITTPVSLSRSAETGGESALFSRLRELGPSSARYEAKDEIGRGGMGVVHRAFDRIVRRSVALKIVKTPRDVGRGDALPFTDSKTITRFLEEAQITGQLDHPGIVPVHDLGLDAAGRLFITMKLVRGEDLTRVFQRIHDGIDGWNRSRGLSVLLRVCEAMAFAHDRGVIHRDLKPGNVMVGEFGEVYVMDWGLARVIGEPDSKDLRLTSSDHPSRVLTTDRSARADGDTETLATMDGDVVGTPAYMPPEQAAGNLDAIGPRSDVYAVGAILYHLLAGLEPYARTGRRLGPRAILAQVLAGAPEPLAARVPDAPFELVAICERAMARDPAARYASMRALESDLRAFLEKRVVTAYETGAVAELRKWVERNSKLAITVAAAGLAVVSLAGWAMLERGRAIDSASSARLNAEEARTERDKVLRVSAVKTLGDLEREWGELFPMTPARAAAMADWIARAEALIAGLSEHEAVLAEIRARGRVLEDGSIDFGSDVQSKWWHDTLAELVAGLSAFTGPRQDAPTLSSMRARYAIASRLGETTLLDAESAWSAAIARIAAAPVYRGLVLEPQLGLVPLGPDTTSGFEEFALWVTGDLPVRETTSGELLLTDTSAAVLVLLPGGETRVGAQSDDPTAPHYEAEVGALEGPVTVVPLDPFFLGKHEITQAQWERVKATRPSSFPGGEPHLGVPITVRHPVETVSYADCRDFARRIGTSVTLPTEAQWEYGCRAGTSTAFFCGPDIRGLDLHANLCDAHAKEKHGSPAWTYELSLNDGFTVTAPIGSFRPNAFGIHDTHGNVAEWCLDHPLPYYVPARPGDGLREYVHDLGRRPLRGGAFAQTPSGARSAGRALDVIDFRSNVAGFRIAKSIEK